MKYNIHTCACVSVCVRACELASKIISPTAHKNEKQTTAQTKFLQVLDNRQN